MGRWCHSRVCLKVRPYGLLTWTQKRKLERQQATAQKEVKEQTDLRITLKKR